MKVGSKASASHSSVSLQENCGVINCDGFLLGYRIEGNGLPAIVIGSVNQYPQTFSQKLREHLQLIFIDHPALVSPPESRQDNTMIEFVKFLEDIDKIREALHLEKIIIIGHSGHAYMALEYAKKYPAHVSHVIMISIAPSLSAQHQQAAQYYWQDMASPARKAAHAAHMQQLPDAQLANLTPEQRYIKEYVRSGAKIWYDFETDASFLWKGTHINMPLLNYIWFTVFRDIDITEGLASFDKPIFLGLGLYDFVVAPFTSWYAIRDKFKHLDVFLFEKSGHVPQMEESDLFAERLLNWLSDNT